MKTRKNLPSKEFPVVIIGAGPAGLSTAYELIRHNIASIVLDKADRVGGLSRTEIYNGFRFDIGGHRFFTTIKKVRHLWGNMLDGDFLKVQRQSSIYYNNRFFNYPLDLFNVLSNMGIIESLLVLSSYIKIKFRPYPEEKTFEHWVVNRFGNYLYHKFFKNYTEDLLGIPCHIIQAKWAEDRIKGLSLTTAVKNAVFNSKHVKTLIDEFYYPLLGSGMMWERFGGSLERQGTQVRLKTEVISLNRGGSYIKNIAVRHDDRLTEIPGDHFISSMPLNELIPCFDPKPPPHVVQAANKLIYRDFILVGLIINYQDIFPENWIYINSPEVKVMRIQNFKNWSGAMVPDHNKTGVGMEYFCTEGDDIWAMSDNELVKMAIRELVKLELVKTADVEDGLVYRQTKAYPLYDSNYMKHLKVIQDFLATVKNLQSIGRNGTHRYNNMDHSMLTGIKAAEYIIGEK